MTLGSGGISPQNDLNISNDPGMGELSAGEGREDKKLIGAVDEEEFDRLVESGEIERDFEEGDLQEPEPADADVEAQDFDRKDNVREETMTKRMKENKARLQWNARRQ